LTQAVREGIRLAKSLGARVTALHTTPQFYPSQIITQEIIARAGEYEAQVKEEAERVLGAVEEAAREAGSPATRSIGPVIVRGRKSSMSRRSKAAT
jgi:nucleotide-binding universal stress UspA family protein